MKAFCVLVLTAAAAWGADFTTGQAARIIIGQPFYTAQQDIPSNTVLGGVSGIAYANNTLFVADSNRVGASPINNRVLVFQNIGGTLPKPTDKLDYTQRCPVCVGSADVVVGQPDFKTVDPVPNPFSTTNATVNPTATGMRTPTAVASDGVHLVVADTDNNRVLIWNSIPTSNNQPADVVAGQPDFNSAATTNVSTPPNAKSMKGPQGVWIQDGKLFVADTQNDRVLIYNHIPTANGAAADLVLGQPDLNTWVQTDLTQQKADAKATNLLNPVSVTSDGVRLYVTDLGHNRVLVWNSIPDHNQAPADIAIGQPDLTSAISNNSYYFPDPNDATKRAKVLCDSNGTDSTTGNPTFPDKCAATLSFPRYALSDGQRLWIADGGNDRVLLFKNIPNASGQAADVILGQIGGSINQASDAADSLRTPMSLAWDGANLFVSDCYNRRISVFSAAENDIPYGGVRNAASLEIFAVGHLAIGGGIQENDQITVTIAGKDYVYKIKSTDGFADVVNQLVSIINANGGDPNVFALADATTLTVILTARNPGDVGNQVTYSVATSPTTALIAVTTGGANLSGGQDAAKIGPGSIVSVMGQNLAETTAVAPGDSDHWPTELAGVQVYFDGVPAPLQFVSPTQVNAQLPFEFLDTTSVGAYVRTEHADGTVTVTTPVAVTIVPENPGIFAYSGQDPRPGIVLHGSSQATGVISVDGSVNAGDSATVTINGRGYTYTVQSSDTLDSIRDALINMINQQDSQVEAYAAGVFDRIRLRARVPGPDGNGISIAASSNDGAQVVMTATNDKLCCANVAYAPVTDKNPAVPGETIIVYATGLGLPQPADGVATGFQFNGPQNKPVNFVSSLAGGSTANVLLSALKPGTIGIWEVHLQLNSGLKTDPLTQLTIAQENFVSNIITFPVVAP